MKKLIAFLTLLLCVSFTEMSAQTIRWQVTGNTMLQIRVNGVLKVDEVSSDAIGHTGIINVPAGASVYVFAYNTSFNSSATLEPIITEDDEWMIANSSADYDFLNEEHTGMQESFTMPDEVPMYVGMHS